MATPWVHLPQGKHGPGGDFSSCFWWKTKLVEVIILRCPGDQERAGKRERRDGRTGERRNPPRLARS